MSFQGSSINRAVRRLFSFTAWGFVFFLLSILILIAGMMRMELAAILFGSAIILLTLYCLSANRIMRSILRRHFQKTADAVDFTVPREGVFPRNAVWAQIGADLPRFSLPGIKVAIEIALEWPGRRALRLETDLHSGSNRSSLEFLPKYRGCYCSREALVVVRDVLGLTRLTLPQPLAESLRVYPSVRPESSGRLPRLEGGGRENRRAEQRRSEQLLEVRKYFPGDDIRKVHWKVFAHTSELFLRIGEEIPPPVSRFLVILDPAPTPAVPAPVEADYLDTLVEHCAAAVLEVLGRGYQVRFVVCGSGKVGAITLEKTDVLLAELAEVWWNDRYALELPWWNHYRVLLFAAPGSANLPRLFDDLKQRGANVRLLFPELILPVQVNPSRGLRHLLVRPPAGQRAARQEDVQLEEFREALHLEIGKWTRRGKWKVDVETI